MQNVPAVIPAASQAPQKETPRTHVGNISHPALIPDKAVPDKSVERQSHPNSTMVAVPNHKEKTIEYIRFWCPYPSAGNSRDKTGRFFNGYLGLCTHLLHDHVAPIPNSETGCPE